MIYFRYALKAYSPWLPKAIWRSSCAIWWASGRFTL